MLSISLRFAFPALPGSVPAAARLSAFAAWTRQRFLRPRVIPLDPYLAADIGIDRYTID